MNNNFYMRVEVNGQALLVGMTMCESCYAVVARSKISDHYKWHKDSETSALDLVIKQHGDE